MRCNAYKCRENVDGYCSCENYITIDENGKCDTYYVTSEEE